MATLDEVKAALAKANAADPEQRGTYMSTRIVQDVGGVFHLSELPKENFDAVIAAANAAATGQDWKKAVKSGATAGKFNRLAEKVYAKRRGEKSDADAG